MSNVGNIIWVICGGFFIAVHYFLLGIILCITIVGIPFGLQVFKLAGLAIWPFNKEVLEKGRTTGCLTLVMNLLWLFIGGIWLCLHHLFWAILLGITIIGIPFAKQHIKMAAMALTPFGKEVREKIS